jgi:hypothetical protein
VAANVNADAALPGAAVDDCQRSLIQVIRVRAIGFAAAISRT